MNDKIRRQTQHSKFTQYGRHFFFFQLFINTPSKRFACLQNKFFSLLYFCGLYNGYIFPPRFGFLEDVPINVQ